MMILTKRCLILQVDIGEMEEAFSVASNLMEIISSHVESFLPKVRQIFNKHKQALFRTSDYKFTIMIITDWKRLLPTIYLEIKRKGRSSRRAKSNSLCF